jgi:hypothetical protein
LVVWFGFNMPFMVKFSDIRIGNGVDTWPLGIETALGG